MTKLNYTFKINILVPPFLLGHYGEKFQDTLNISQNMNTQISVAS